MATDIAPELYEKIQADFKSGVNGNKGVQSIMRRVIKGKASQGDMTDLAERFGREASKALRGNILLSELPNQTLYWNIAERTIQPLLIEAYNNVNYYAVIQQDFADRAAGLSIRVVKGARPEERARQVMEMAVNSVTQEELRNALTDPTITAVRKFYDDFQMENAKLRDELGLETTVVRVYDGVGLKGGAEPCEWCISREGVYSYADAVDNGVFERHPGCGCTIEYHTSRGVDVQTDWRTNTWESRS